MSNSGRSMSTPGWCTFALLGGVLVVAFGAFASATPRDKSKATTPVLAVDNAAAAMRSGQPTAVADKLKSANSNQNSPATLSSAQLSLKALPTVKDPSGSRTAMGGGVNWFEDFESYPDGNCMDGEGGWEGWLGDAGADACLQEVIWHSENSAVDIGTNLAADLVRVYSGFDSGFWAYCTWQFIPEDFSGDSFFILLNTYPATNWSTQISFNSATGLMQSQFENAEMPFITGEWIQLCVEIDFDADIQRITYDGVLLSEKSWTEGVSGGGQLAIEAVDLFSNGASPVYYDDLSLITPVCGEKGCETGEDSCSCPEDCGGPGFCGDTICCEAEGETCENCEDDCNVCPSCGNGIIEPGEDCDPPFEDVCPDGELCDANCQCPGVVPPNDDCQDRIDIFDGVTDIDTTGATTDGLPTNGLGDCADFGDPQIYNDIWFNYTATCTDVLTVSTCNTVNYDSKIAIYEDCDTGLCPRGGDEIGCNDDGPGCGGFTTIATAPVVQDSCYKIRIGGFSAADFGSGTVNIRCGPLVGGCCVNGECVGDTEEADCEGNWSPNSSCTGEFDLPLPICNTGCSWDNGPPLDDFGSPGSQCAPDFPFGAGAADDFILKDPGENPCQIDHITTWTAHFGGDGTQNPNDYLGVNITVYADADPKGPGGEPNDGDPDCGHNGDVVVTVNIPIEDIDFVQEAPVCTPNRWRLDIPVDFELPKNVKMWLEIQPIMPFTGVGQVAVSLSQNSTGHPTQQIFPAAGLPDWTVIGGNADACAPDTPQAGTRRDLAFIMIGEKPCNLNEICDPGENSCNCPEDCGTCEGTCVQGECCGDGEVNGHEECDYGSCGTCPTDGPIVGPNGEVGSEDLAWVLGNWGPFIDNPNCDPLGTACPADLICLDDLNPIPGNQNIGPEELSKILGSWGPCCDTPDGDPCNPGFGGGDNQCVEGDCDDSCECVGRGACCTEDPAFCDAHENVTAAECADAGGIYAGDDTTCADCADPACFDAEGSCFEVHFTPGCSNQECCGLVCNTPPDGPFCCEFFWDSVCVGLAEELCPPPSCGDGVCEGDEDACNCGLPGGDCEGECDDPNQCPSGSLFSQSITPPEGLWTFGTSDVNPGFRVFENYDGVAGDICDIHWWGINAEFVPPFTPCDAGDAEVFDIEFWNDAGGAPDIAGGPVFSYLGVTPTKTHLGTLYAGAFELLAYDLDLTPCSDLVSGWVSIQSVDSGACWFLWGSSGDTGEGSAYQEGAAPPEVLFDLSLCLTPGG